MIAALLSLLGSSAIGSLIGGVFALINRMTDLKAKVIDNNHEKDRWAHDLEVRESDLLIVREEAQARKDVAITEGNATVDAARMAAIAQVQANDKITAEEIKSAGWWGFLFVWASVLNKLIRPVLTLVLALAALYVNWLVIEMLTKNWSTMTQVQQFETGMQAFAWVTAQASTAFSYWFVARGTGK